MIMVRGVTWPIDVGSLRGWQVRKATATTRAKAKTAECTLADMNWRRGVLLAGLNLAAALAMIVVLDARDARFVRERDARSEIRRSTPEAAPGFVSDAPEPTTSAKLVLVQDSEATGTVTFDPCEAWIRNYPIQEGVVRLGNPPAAILSGWRLQCPAKWSLAIRVLGTYDTGLTRQSLTRHYLVEAVLCVLIVFQWFLIGSFPLTSPRRSWQEPGAFITIGALIAAALATNSFTEDLARLPDLFVIVAWFWWFGLLIWRCIQLGWRTVMKSRTTSVAV